MKIVEIMPVYDVCGVTRFVVDLCNQLSREHEVVLAVLYHADRAEQFGLSPRVRTVGLNKQRRFDWQLSLRLRELLRQEKADVVHLHSASVLQYAAASILTLRSSRYFYTLHSESSFENPSPVRRWLTEQFLLRPGRCQTIAVSSFAEQSLSYRTPVIPLGRDLKASQLSDKKAEARMSDIRNRHHGSILLCVGNLTPVKNQLMLCRAVRKLVRKGYNIELVLIGKAPDEAYFRQLVPLLHHERIHYIGPRNNVMAYMAHADYFCLSSHTESGPMVLIEAFFAGLIPLCTPCGDVPNKIQHGENGFCAKDCSEEAYEQLLEEALCLPPERKNDLKEKTRNSFRKYSMNRCTEQYLHLFCTP